MFFGILRSNKVKKKKKITSRILISEAHVRPTSSVFVSHHQLRTQAEAFPVSAITKESTKLSYSFSKGFDFVKDMAFWLRIRSNNLKIACTQFRRCFIQPPLASFVNSTPKPHPYWAFHNTPTRVFNSVRFFAAPVQFQSKWKKEEEDDTSEARLNDQIKAQYVRLVFEDGQHSIVSSFEALECARKLKLDLVEVQRNGNPPVCKIMDYHKEIYKKQEKEKERAKSKVTLRKGECKEMRFSEKTEAKDLKMKADMVKKLMEKGYRVKCKATGSENQDMTGVLSRLLALIQDITVVESGPSMAKKEAFMIIRHVKYGLPKKGGGAARKLQDAENMAVNDQEDDAEILTARSSDSIEYENQNFVESGFEAKDDVFYTVDPVPPAEPENRYKRVDRQSENKVQSHLQMPPAETENRYKRAEPRNRFQQTASNNTGQNYRGPGMRDAVSPVPWMNQTRRGPVDFDVNHRTGNTNQTNIPGPGSRYSRPPPENIPKHGPPNPSAPNTPRSSYGLFSSPKHPEAQGVQAGMHRNREGNPQDSTWQPYSLE